MQFASMNIAVVGTPAVVEEYALLYASAGHHVSIAFREGEQGRIARRLNELANIDLCSIEEAGANADMVIIAALPRHVRELAYWLGDVRDKVIVDASANLLATPEDMLNTVGAIKAITGSSNIVKVFSTRGYEQLLEPLLGNSHVQLLLAGDSRKAKMLVKILAHDLGITKFVDFGGDDKLPMFNDMIRCWRGINAPVSVPEAVASV
jgi:predicted dinucleotide-binding enzyme